MKYNKAKAYQFDSRWEMDLANGIMKDIKYHGDTIIYKRPESEHKYTPDWTIFKTNKCIHIEAKGRFRAREEMAKYVHVKRELDNQSRTYGLKEVELVFLFQNPKTPVFGAKARKDGSKTSHAEWADKHGFRWFTETTIKELLQ